MASPISCFNIFKANGIFIGLEIFLSILAYGVFGLGSILPSVILDAVKYDSSNRDWNLAYPVQVFGSIQYNIWVFCVLFSNSLIWGFSGLEISATVNKKFGAMITACVIRCIHFLVFITLAILYFAGIDYVYNAEPERQPCLFDKYVKWNQYGATCNDHTAEMAAEMVTNAWWFSSIVMDFIRIILQVIIIHKIKAEENVSSIIVKISNVI